MKKLSSADFCLISSATIGENQQQSLGSFMTPFGGPKLRKIWVCNDLWMDIFPFFGRPQLGLKLALISPRFDALVDKHFDCKSELTLWRPIEIRKNTDNEAENAILCVCVCDELVPFPLPDHPLPKKIRFRELQIDFIDHSVIEFLRANPHVFAKSTHLAVDIFSSKTDVTPIWNVFLRQIWPIFGPNIRHLNISPSSDHLDNFLRLISPTIFSDLARLNSIQSYVMFPDQIADDDGPPTAASSAGQVLSKWLHSPTTDGQPKRLRSLNHCLYASGRRNFEWINSFKEVFLRATSSANYYINFSIVSSAAVPNLSQPTEQFELVNERTKEKLTLQKEVDFGDICWWIMERCPMIGQTAAKDEHLYAGVHILLAGDNNCIGNICNDVWLNVLPFFDRVQLGLKLALFSHRFNALVDKHFNGFTDLLIWREILIERSEDGRNMPQMLVIYKDNSIL